jgi:hypothetical protein
MHTLYSNSLYADSYIVFYLKLLSLEIQIIGQKLLRPQQYNKVIDYL